MNTAGSFNRVGWLVGMFVYVLGAGVAHSAAQQPVKVHKGFITVSAPDGQGMVTVMGRAGAIESAGPVTVQLIRVADNYKIPLEIDREGGFAARVSAEGGEQIRIMARNQEGRQSYGTFKVPAGAAEPVGSEQPGATAKSVDGPPEQAEQTVTVSRLKPEPINPMPLVDKGQDQAEPETIELAVIITVVNTRSGEIIAAQRVAGPTRARPDQKVFFDKIIEGILDRCVSVIKAEFRRREGMSDRHLDFNLKSPALSESEVSLKEKTKAVEIDGIKEPHDQ